MFSIPYNLVDYNLVPSFQVPHRVTLSRIGGVKSHTKSWCGEYIAAIITQTIFFENCKYNYQTVTSMKPREDSSKEKKTTTHKHTHTFILDQERGGAWEIETTNEYLDIFV